MALLSRHFAGCMSRLARPCLPRYVHRIPAAFAPLHRSTEKIAHNSNRRCHSRASFGAETETDSKQSVTVRPAMLSELDDVAWLRAEAFYEDQPHLRYVGSFKRQFKEQEARSLRDRIRQRQGQVGPDCVCLVAIEEADGEGPEVLGTLDVEPPGSALARDREAPAESTYVLNVVVSSKHRRKGMGRLLMAAAADLARQEWASSKICAHVSAQNDAAIALYEACGYQKTSLETALNDTPMAGGSLLGKQLFMVASL